jgi:thiamine biosynthesis lipoprotein ApbE
MKRLAQINGARPTRGAAARLTFWWMLFSVWPVSSIFYPVAAVQAEKRNPLESRFEYTQIHMGVAVRLAVYAPDEARAKQACAAAFARVAQLEDVASDYRPSSELMRFCAHFDTADAPALRISDDLWKMLAHAQMVSQKSHGAFDVTVSPIVKLWRQSRQSKVLPTREQIRQAKWLVGWRKLQLNTTNQTARLLVPGMRLDLGGIAKGYAGDEAIKRTAHARHQQRVCLKPAATSWPATRRRAKPVGKYFTRQPHLAVAKWRSFHFGRHNSMDRNRR